MEGSAAVGRMQGFEGMSTFGNCIVIRQSAVLPTDVGQPKKWREIFISEWLLEYSSSVELWCSSFDHYGKVQRQTEKCKKFPFKLRLIKSPGYRKNISLLRIFDAWCFSTQIFVSLCFRGEKNTIVICSIPTPESAFAVFLASKIIGFKVIYDIRDNWLRIGGNGFFSAMFRKYNSKLLALPIKASDGFTGFSNQYIDAYLHHYKIENVTEGTNSINFLTKSGIQLPAERRGPNKYFDFLFFGTLNSQFSFEPLKNYHSTLSKMFPRVRFYIYGTGNDFKNVEDTFSTSTNIFVMGHKPFEEIALHASNASGFFCFYKDKDLFTGHITNKIVEFLEFGGPIIHNFDKNPKFNGVEVDLGHSVVRKSLPKCVEDVLRDAEAPKVSNDVIDEQLNKSNFIKFLLNISK